MRKSDRDYHESCQKTESARQEWEAAVYKVHRQHKQDIRLCILQDQPVDVPQFQYPCPIK